MSETDIANTGISDYSNVITDYSVDTQSTDGTGEQKETRWQNTRWTQQFGYYKSIPELHASINAKGYWTVGKGYQTNEITELLLMTIKGNGTDTFNSILQNMITTYCIGGDSYAEIIRDKNGQLVNLKPLDPEVITIVGNTKGKILRYEQTSKIKGRKPKIFMPEDMFHLSRNRIADEMHGQSIIDPLEETILMINEAKADYRKLLHRNVYPVRIWHLDTDNEAKITAFKAKVANTKHLGEDIFIPKGAVEQEIASTPSNSVLDSKVWINQLTGYFYQAAEVPQIIVGGGAEITEAGVKVAYLAYQQPIEKEQLFIEEQVLSQLNLEINLTFPASLENEMLSDKAKEGSMVASTPEDTSLTKADGQVGAI